MALETVTSENYPSFKEASKTIFVVSMKGCGPCSAYHPLVEGMAKSRPDIMVGEVDVHAHNADFKRDFPIYNVPTTILMVDGVCVEKFEGYRSRDFLEDKVRKYFPQ